MVTVMDPKGGRPGVSAPAPVEHQPGAPRKSRAHGPRPATAARREEILRAAMETFGARGYYNGSLAEVAERVGMTHAGVLHHFGSKDRLLLEVLEYRDRSDVEHLEGRQPPGGLALFHHLVKTARLNAQRPGIVQTFAVLSAEAVTEDHPGQDWFRDRYTELRRLVTEALAEVCADDDPPDAADLASAAASVLAVMDGLQIQWLLDPDAVDLAQATAFAIDAILASAIAGKRRRSAL
jgi:AcrR family transcriptional regulator